MMGYFRIVIGMTCTWKSRETIQNSKPCSIFPGKVTRLTLLFTSLSPNSWPQLASFLDQLIMEKVSSFFWLIKPSILGLKILISKKFWTQF